MANIFKSFKSNNYSITEFPVYYDFSYNYQSGSSQNSNDVQVLYGVQYHTSGTRYPNSQYELFNSVIQNFYSPIPYVSYGTTTNSYIPSASVYVITITQHLFGNTIVPKTFSLNFGTSSSFDDGNGNIYISSSNSSSLIGRIFYDKGIALLRPTSSLVGDGLTLNGLTFGSGSTVTVNFTSSLLLYEHSIKAEIEPNEFLQTFSNPTISGITLNATQSAFQLMVSGTLTPYVTTIGLYNDNNELLAVAKPSVPIQRTADTPQTFIIKFDVHNGD